VGWPDGGLGPGAARWLWRERRADTRRSGPVSDCPSTRRRRAPCGNGGSLGWSPVAPPIVPAPTPVPTPTGWRPNGSLNLWWGRIAALRPLRPALTQPETVSAVRHVPARSRGSPDEDSPGRPSRRQSGDEVLPCERSRSPSLFGDGADRDDPPPTRREGVPAGPRTALARSTPGRSTRPVRGSIVRIGCRFARSCQFGLSCRSGLGCRSGLSCRFGPCGRQASRSPREPVGHRSLPGRAPPRSAPPATGV